MKLELRNAGPEPIALPTSGIGVFPSLLAVTLHLVDRDGVERVLDLSEARPERRVMRGVYDEGRREGPWSTRLGDRVIVEQR